MNTLLPPDWLLVTGAVFLAIYVYSTWTYDYFKKNKLPFRKPLPLLGSMKSMAFRTESVAQFVRSTYDLGKGHRVVGFFEFRKPLLILRDPEIIKLLCVKEFDHFMNHRNTMSEKTDPLFTKSLLLLKDKRWKNMRTTLSPAFTSSKMKGMFLFITECGQQLKDYFEKICQEQPGGPDAVLSIEMKDCFTRFANDVIATSAFGVKCDSLKYPKNEFYMMGKDITNVPWWKNLLFLVLLIIPKLGELLGVSFFSKKATNFFKFLVHDTINTREREGIVRPDMIHLLKEASKSAEQDPDKMKMDLDDIAAQAIIFFFAGFETIAVLLSFTTYLLALHPDIQSKLQEEIDSELEKEGGQLSYEAVQRMKYLDMVVSETLRMYPPFSAMDRECIKPMTVPGTDSHPPIPFQKGDAVWLPIMAIHHDPEHFTEPEKFDPERFSEERKDSIQPFSYIPFGVGPRICIAQRFALMEAKVALVYLVSHFSFHVVDKTPIPMKLSLKSFNTTSADGFWCGIKLRNKVK